MDRRERDWLQRIAESPHEGSLRLIYADWLQDRGDPRGQLISLHEQYQQLSEEPSLREIEHQKLQLLDSGKVVPLEANCIEQMGRDELELAVAKLGIPLPWSDDRLVSPELARLSCRPFDFTNSNGMRFNLMPGGLFVMGRTANSFDAEHHVRLTKPFHIGAYQVTQAQYEQVMGANPSAFAEYGVHAKEVSGRDTARFPVEQVSWDDAVLFCERLAAGTEGYSLPTEAQWEYACRAGTKFLFHCGNKDDDLGDYAVVGRENSTSGPEPVGSKSPNPWQLFDMHGNVRAWCQDWRDHYLLPGHKAEDTRNVQYDPCVSVGGSLSNRVCRGGSWRSPLVDRSTRWTTSKCEAGFRDGEIPGYKGSDLGFRVVRNSRFGFSGG